MTAPGGWFTDLLDTPSPGERPDATNVVPAFRRPPPASLQDYGHLLRQFAGGLAGGAAKFPEQITELGKPMEVQLPADLIQLSDNVDKPGPRVRRPVDISTPVRDFVAGGPPKTVSDSSASQIGDFAGQIGGWELGARSGLLGKISKIGLKTEEVAPGAVTGKQAYHLRNALEKGGGFTFDPRTGEFVKSGGVMVGGVPGQQGMVIDGKLMRGHIEDFLAKNADLLKKKGMMAGGWRDPESGKIYLDVSQKVPRRRALDVLRARGEKAGWDLDKMQEIANPDAAGAVSAGSEAPALEAARPVTWTPAQLEAYGVQHGVPGLGRVSPRHEVTLTNGEKVNVPGGFDGTFSYHDLLSLKAEGINPNLLPKGIHEKIHAKMVRSMTPEDMTDPEIFRALSFGITSPNSPLTSNEFTVSRLMPRSMEDISALAKADPKTLPHELGVDAGSKGGLGTSGSVDYANVVKLAQLFEKNPKWFRRAADEPWDQYVDRLATQIPGLGTKTASLGAVWQDLPNAAVSAVDRHMTELAMPHILEHPELGPDFRARVVKSYNGQDPAKLKELGGPVKTLEQIRERDPIYARDFLASLINDPHRFNFRTSKGEFGKNVPQAMRLMDFVEEPEKTTLMNPYYREALKYNAAHQGAGESLFASQWRLWDKQRGRIEPHEVMFPGLNRLPRMDIADAREAYNAHKAAGYTLGRPTINNPVAEGGQLPAVRRLLNPMSLGYWGLAGLTAGELARPDEK